MEWFGTTRPLSRPRWTTLRTDALRELSIEWFGADDKGEPLSMLSLRERASHSNFATCTLCNQNKARWLDFRKGNKSATALDARTLKAEVHEHINEVKAQRVGMMQLAQECASHHAWQFGYDDGCGSDFLYMPSAVREDAADASRYKYRFAMMCNLYPGALLRCSLIPPCVIKGGNFGCTAYFSSLARLHDIGKLGSHIVRQTDSGPDNDCKVTHAFHWALVHFGVIQKITWGRLPPKHSHNFADRVNSMVKEVIFPKGGTGGGCRSPWDFEEVVKRALKSQRGEPEFAWHLANTNWLSWFQDSNSIHKEFEDFTKQRFWVYEYDPDLSQHGYVRVTYKEAITTKPTDARPCEFLPVEEIDGTLRTKKEGLIFMQDARVTPNCSHPDARFPTLTSNPGVDSWKLGRPTEGVPTKSTWQQDKVLRDVLEHRMLNFSSNQKQQWHAMHEFHSLYETADSVPALPLSLSSPDGSSFVMQHGSPYDWDAMWTKVAWRFDRPHKPKPNATEAPDPSPQSQQPAPQKLPNPAALNVVSGANAPRLAKKHAQFDEMLLGKARALTPKGVSEVAANQLYFAVTPEPDGELSVGLVRVEKVDQSTVDFSWFKRKSDAPFWSDTPTFVPFMPKGRVEKQAGVGIESLLSPPVELTKSSAAQFKADAKSIAGQTVRMTKASMMLLRAFITIHRGDLLNEVEGSGEESEAEGDE